MPSRLLVTMILLTAVAGLSACHTLTTDPRARSLPSDAPYPQSTLIDAVSWDFDRLPETRRALGSDLWPCTGGRDGNTYCAWGDGGGFDGNDDNIGRVSLGFARIVGVPTGRRSRHFLTRNVWGEPPYAENAATFGGKVVSLVSAGGMLYAIGGFWTPENSANPVHESGSGPRYTLAWSADFAKTWQIAPWSAPSLLGNFLNFPRDNAGSPDAFIYLYYLREGDRNHLYLKRVAEDRLRTDPSVQG